FELLAHGEYLPPEGAEGPGIRLKMPQVETVPGGPHGTLTSLTFPLGGFHEGHANVTAPAECTTHLSWQAAAKLSDLEGSEATANTEAPSSCPSSGTRTPSKTRLEGPTTLFEEEEAALFAFVNGEPVGGVPSGHVQFRTVHFDSGCFYGE